MLFSIIIPHHNIPNLLRRLLDSIPQRKDVEIIVVDDNSDAAQVNFDIFPGLERSDVKVCFDKKGGGGGYARNIGLKHATGKWIIFADADDFFNYCFNDILDEYLGSDADIIYCNANSLDTDYYTSAFRTMHLNSYIDGFIKGDVNAEVGLRYLFGEPWCKIIRRDLIVDNKICFDETSIHNDTTFSYLCGFNAKKIIADKRAMYCVTSRENSVSKQISEQKKLERIKVFSGAYHFFHEHEINVRIDKHFRQLYESKQENRLTYQKGLEIMNSNGISSNTIRLQMFKQFWLHLIINVLKHKAVLNLMKSMGVKCITTSSSLQKYSV